MKKLIIKTIFLITLFLMLPNFVKAANFNWGNILSTGKLMPNTNDYAYVNFSPPEMGKTYEDPIFGTTIRRLTDIASNQGVGKDSGFAYGGYDRYRYFNANSSKLFLDIHVTKAGEGMTNFFRIYNTIDGSLYKNLPSNFKGHPDRTHFSPKINELNILYYTNYVGTNNVYSYNIDTETETIIKTFSTYKLIRIEAVSDDGDLFMLRADGDFILWRKSNDSITVACNSTALNINDGGITLESSPRMIWRTNNHGGGTYVINNDCTTAHDFYGDVSTSGHSNADATYLWTADGQGTTFGLSKIVLHFPNTVTKIWSAAPNVFALHAGWPLGNSISSNSYLASDVYDTQDYMPSSMYWPAYANEIVVTNTQTGIVWRLVHHRSRYKNTLFPMRYYATPRVTVSPNGKYALYASSFNNVNWVDAYLLEIPIFDVTQPAIPTGLLVY